jgi:hypothetical protein
VSAMGLWATQARARQAERADSGVEQLVPDYCQSSRLTILLLTMLHEIFRCAQTGRSVWFLQSRHIHGESYFA